MSNIDIYENYPKETIILESPITVNFKSADGAIRTEEITQLILRKPDAEDLEDIDLIALRKIGSYYPLISRLTGQPLAVIKRVQLNDLLILIAKFKDFLPNGLKTILTSLVM